MAPENTIDMAFDFQVHADYDYSHMLDDENVPEDEEEYKWPDEEEEKNGEADSDTTESDPDDLFKRARELLEELKCPTSVLSSTGYVEVYHEFMIQSSADFIYGSNHIENAGMDYEATIGLCRDMLQYRQELKSKKRRVPREEYIEQMFIAYNLAPRTEEHAAITKEMEEKERAKAQARLEVEQHVLTLSFMIEKFIMQDEPLSEDLLLKTHIILTEGIPSHDGVESTSYSGV